MTAPVPTLLGSSRLAARRWAIVSLLLLTVALGSLLGPGLVRASDNDEPEAATTTTAPARPKPARVELNDKLGQIKVHQDPSGQLLVTVRTDVGRRKVTPDELVRLIDAAQADQRAHGWLFVLFNITSLSGVLWVSIGFLGQALFTFRMVLQWLVSEKHGKSVVPVAFWWGSLIGGVMLLTYFCWRRDIVGIIGQSTGAFVYARNLMLIYSRGDHLKEAQALNTPATNTAAEANPPPGTADVKP